MEPDNVVASQLVVSLLSLPAPALPCPLSTEQPDWIFKNLSGPMLHFCSELSNGCFWLRVRAKSLLEPTRPDMDWSPPMSLISPPPAPLPHYAPTLPTLLSLELTKHTPVLGSCSLGLFPQVATYSVSYLVQVSGQTSLYQEGLPWPSHLKQHPTVIYSLLDFQSAHHHVTFVYIHRLSPPTRALVWLLWATCCPVKTG